MATENKRYYWLKFQEDFFSSLRVKKLRKLGSDYLIIYLKMQLFSLRNNGYLEYKGIEDTFAQELALELDEDADKVQLTLSFLQSCNLLEVRNDEFFLPYVEINTGSETASTKRSRECRANKGVALQQDCNKNATLEIRDKSIDIKETKSNKLDLVKEKPVKHKYGEYNHVQLTDKEYNKLLDDFGKGKLDKCIQILDEYIEVKAPKYKNHNLVLRGWVNDEFKKRYPCFESNTKVNKEFAEQLKARALGK